MTKLKNNEGYSRAFTPLEEGVSQYVNALIRVKPIT